MSRHSKQGLGLMSHPGANTSHRTVSRPSWCSAALPLVLAQGQDASPCISLLLPAALLPPGGNVLAGGRCPPSNRYHYFFFWIAFSTVSHSSSFLSSVSFPVWGFVILFSQIAHSSFPCDSPGEAQLSCRRRTCQGGLVPDGWCSYSVEPLLSEVPVFDCIPEALCLEEHKPSYFSWG